MPTVAARVGGVRVVALVAGEEAMAVLVDERGAKVGKEGSVESVVAAVAVEAKEAVVMVAVQAVETVVAERGEAERAAAKAMETEVEAEADRAEDSSEESVARVAEEVGKAGLELTVAWGAPREGLAVKVEAARAVAREAADKAGRTETAGEAAALVAVVAAAPAPR